MPPIQFISFSLATWSAGPKTLTFPTPAGVRAGDALIYIGVSPSFQTITTPADLQVLGLFSDAGAGVTFLACIRYAEAGEAASRAYTFAAAPASPPLGACLLYRGLAAGQTVPVASGYSKFSAATTHIVSPSGNRVAYSDLHIAVGYSNAQNATFTPLNNLVERVDHANGVGVNGSMAISDIRYDLLGLPGASGAKEQTCSGSSTGAAISLFLASTPVPDSRGVGYIPNSDAPGGIGLVDVGV